MPLYQRRFSSTGLKRFWESPLGARSNVRGSLFLTGGFAWDGVNSRITYALGVGYYLLHEATGTFVPNPFGTTQRGGIGNTSNIDRMGDFLVFCGRWTRSLHPGGAQYVALFDLVNGGWIDLAPGSNTSVMNLSMAVGSSGDKIFINYLPDIGSSEIDGVTFHRGAYYDGSWHAWDLDDGFDRLNYFIEGADSVFGGEVLTISPVNSPPASPMVATTTTLSTPWNTDPPGNYYQGNAAVRTRLDGGNAYLSAGAVAEDGGPGQASGVLRSVGGALPDIYFSDAPDFNVRIDTPLRPWTRPTIHGGSMVAGVVLDGLTSRYRTGSGTDSGAVSDRVFWLNPSTGLVTASSDYPDDHIYDIISHGGELYAVGAYQSGTFPTVFTGRVRKWNAGGSSWDLVFQHPPGGRSFGFQVIDLTI